MAENAAASGMKTPEELQKDQIAFWNGDGGEQWAEEQEPLDAMLAPVAEALIAHARIKPGERVLDVGCGNGATTFELAELVGPEGHVAGIDISVPMLSFALAHRAKRDNIEYIYGDAASWEFEPDVDVIFSRFGVMFFGDPTAAFANLKKVLKTGGRIVFACWRKPDENPWMQVPLHAAYLHVPRPPPANPEDPGPFSFADPARVKRIFADAGLPEPRFTPVDLQLDIAAGGGLEGAVKMATTIGPTSRALRDQPEAMRAAVAEAVSIALEPYLKGKSVALGAAIWLVDCDAA
jgi:SAM-dependent methyltransferase